MYEIKKVSEGSDLNQDQLFKQRLNMFTMIGQSVQQTEPSLVLTSLAKDDSLGRKKRSATEAGMVLPQKHKMIKRESLSVIKEEEEVSIVKRSVTYEGGSIP